MDEYARVALAGQLYRMHKEAGAGEVIGAIGRLPRNILRVVDAGAKGAGRAAYTAAGKGLKGRAAQAVVRTSPYTVGGALALDAGAGEYIRSKTREFGARQYATQPYYDPQTQRFI
jgi:hypothetical protein